MKNKNVLALITLMLISVFLIQTTSALIIYLRPIKMRLYTDVVPGQTGRAEGTYVIENRNNVTITVDFEPMGDIADVTQIENSIIMEPDETRNVDFVVELTEPGTYNGGIAVTYSSGTTKSVSFETEVTVIASESMEDNFFTGNFFLGLTGMHIIGILVIVIILLSLVYLIKRRK